MEMKTIQRREKRWARRGCLLSLFGYLPLRICMSLLRCPEKRTRGTEGWGKAKKVDREKVGKARTSAEPVRLSATSNLHVPSSMPGKEKERDRRMGKGHESG